MEGLIAILVLGGLLTVAGVAHKLARSRLHARLEGLRVRLGLMETTWEEKGLMSLVTGRRGATQLTFAGRLWGPIQVRSPIAADLPLGLSLTPQGKGTHLRGMQDIQVGIPDLDAHFQVQGEHPAAAIRYLREERTQQALRSLVAVDPQAAVTHGEVRLTVDRLEVPGQLERTVQLANRMAQELAEATGAPILPAAAPEPSPEPSAPARGPEIVSRPLRSTGAEPVVTAVTEGGLVRPRFSPGYVVGIQREHGLRRLLLRCLYTVSAGWITVLTLDQFFYAELLFSFPHHHSTWDALWGISALLILGLRFLLRRCASCGSPIGDGYGVTRLVATHSITCTNCGIELQ